VLVSYLLTATGFPLPTVRSAAGGPAFPCQHHACGCVDAEQCWQSCCCLSVEERLAWARSQNIEPPAPPPSSGWRSKRLRDQEDSCPSCVKCKPVPDEPSSPHAASSEGENTGKSMVTGIGALQCRGASTLWVSTGAVLPATPLTWRSWVTPLGAVEAFNAVAPRRTPICLFEPPRTSLATFSL
jgi:hypothetical protein